MAQDPSPTTQRPRRGSTASRQLETAAAGEEADLPGFLTPPPAPVDSPPASSTTPAVDAAFFSEPATGSGSDASSGPPRPTTESRGPSPASTADSLAAARVDRAAIERGLAAVIRVLSSIVHRRLAPRADALARQLWFDEQVWKADAEDIKEISQPAARLIARRLRVPAEAVDVVAVMLGSAGYVEKNLDKDSRIRGHVIDAGDYTQPDEEQQ